MDATEYQVEEEDDEERAETPDIVTSENVTEPSENAESTEPRKKNKLYFQL